MKNILEIIKALTQKRDEALSTQLTEKNIEHLHVSFLGRKGKVTDLMEQLKDLPLEDKKIAGPLINQFKTETQALFDSYVANIKEQELQKKLAQEKNFDVSAYKYSDLKGTTHIYSRIIEDLENVFISMGYDIIDGPEIENEYHNFESLNIPADHPAREEDDSFFLKHSNMLLRTQTSSVQARAMRNTKPPMAFVSPGRVYRREATDQTHDFLFTQIEALLIDKNISVSNLIATAHTFLRKVLENDALNIRVRPGYFPFVEPGLELDASCPFCKHGCSICKHTGWIELFGSGMIHPNVLKQGNINPQEYSGFAIGMGIERLAMIKYGINDIRLFHSSKIPFLDQF